MALRKNIFGGWEDDGRGSYSQQFMDSTENLVTMPTYTDPGISHMSDGTSYMRGGESVLRNPNNGGLDMRRFVASRESPGFGFNLPTFEMAGSVMGGIGSLAKGWAAMKGLGLAEEELEFKRGAFDKNFAQQKQAYDDTVRQYNNAQGERQAFVNATHANPSLSDIRTLELA